MVQSPLTTMKSKEYSRSANLIVGVTKPSDTVEVESEAIVTFTSGLEGSKQRCRAISVLSYTSDVPESRSAVAFRPLIVTGVRASS